MKKINKILLSPMPIVAALPTIAFATSCNTIDYVKALEWYEAELTKAQAAFEAKSLDANLKMGLSNVAEIERLFIKNKVTYYWLRTIVNFRQDRYNKEHGVVEDLCVAWDAYYGSSGDERKLYQQYKQDHSDEWLAYNTPIQSGGVAIDFYQVLSVLNAFVAEKGQVLKDLTGWGFHIIDDADDLLVQGQRSYTDQLFYADVDGANIGHIYANMNSQYKSPTLALYKYYTQYTDLNDKLSYYRQNILNLDDSWNEDQIYDHLYTRLSTNFYLLQYTENYTDIKFDKEEHLTIIADAINMFIKRIFPSSK